MKLLTDLNEGLEYISEAVDGRAGMPKQYFIKGTFIQTEKDNRNNRRYAKYIMEREVDRYRTNYINNKRAFGELGHPEGPTINLDRVSHLITHLEECGNDYIGTAKILDTPSGKIVKNFIDEGAQLGVSTRGLGTVRMVNGIQMVNDDFFLATAGDIVADPSAQDAFVRGIMENKEWMFIAGKWQERNFDVAKKEILEANRNQIEEVKLRHFESWLSKL